MNEESTAERYARFLKTLEKEPSGDAAGQLVLELWDAGLIQSVSGHLNIDDFLAEKQEYDRITAAGGNYIAVAFADVMDQYCALLRADPRNEYRCFAPEAEKVVVTFSSPSSFGVRLMSFEDGSRLLVFHIEQLVLVWGFAQILAALYPVASLEEVWRMAPVRPQPTLAVADAAQLLRMVFAPCRFDNVPSRGLVLLGRERHEIAEALVRGALVYATAHEFAHVLMQRPAPHRLSVRNTGPLAQRRDEEIQADLLAFSTTVPNEPNRFKRFYLYIGARLMVETLALHDDLAYVYQPASHPLPSDRWHHIEAYADHLDIQHAGEKQHLERLSEIMHHARRPPLYRSREHAHETIESLFMRNAELLHGAAMRFLQLDAIWWDSLTTHSPDAGCVELARQLDHHVTAKHRARAASIGGGDLGVGQALFAELFDLWSHDPISESCTNYRLSSWSDYSFPFGRLAADVHDFLARARHPLVPAILESPDAFGSVVAIFYGLLHGVAPDLIASFLAQEPGPLSE